MLQPEKEEGMEKLLSMKDAKNSPVFLPTVGKTIVFSEEILPFWS